MKKIFMILLALSMVLPMALVGSVGAANVTEKPFYLLNWQDDVEDYENVYGMPYLHANQQEEMIDLNATITGSNTTDITELAEYLKDDFNSRPKGTRYINFLAPAGAVYSLVEEVIYMEEAVEVLKAWTDAFLKEYKSIGGELDGLLLDFEYIDGNSYYLSQKISTDMTLLDRIVKHPMYKENVRPLLEERGFQFFPDPTPEAPEIFSIYTNSGAQYAQSRAIWDTVMRNRFAMYMNEAVYEPLMKYYPDAVMSDYQSKDTQAWLMGMDNNGNVRQGGNYITIGNSSNDNTYAYVPSTNFYKDPNTQEPIYKNPVAYNDTVFADNPFKQILWDAVRFKDMTRSSKTGIMNAWITFYDYSSNTNSYSRTPYYSEILYHIGMLNPEPFIGYIIMDEVAAKGDDYDYAMKIVSEILDELTRVAGYSDRKAVIIPTNWNDDFILSGMYANGRNIWRITPDTTNGMTLDNFKVEGADPTFSINGQTITFPGGKILEDSTITEVGTCGFWVETDANTMPVVTYSATRYADYPSFQENFEGYKDGEEFTLSMAQPVAAWEIKKGKTGSGKIQANGNNQVLAMNGTFAIKSVQMPQNISAGDSYAENQMWEVTITVPSDMAADAEIIALSSFGRSSKAEDGGFKIAGGKVFYFKENDYVEIEGLDIAAGGTFTFKRDFDFNTADAYTSDYYVYDANGGLVARIKDVPVSKKVDLPVKGIGVSCDKVTGAAVLVDDFRLYPTGVAADFSLYDATTGIEVEEGQATNRSTAYRFSWLNATATEKVYTIIAAFYNGDTLVEEKVLKEVKMAPGTDSVETGIVEVAEGQSVKIYVRNDSQPDKDDEGNFVGKPNGSNKKPNGGNGLSVVTIVIIIAAVFAVVVIAFLVLVVMLMAKKKKALAAGAAVEAVEEATEEAPAEEVTEEAETPEESSAE